MLLVVLIEADRAEGKKAMAGGVSFIVVDRHFHSYSSNDDHEMLSLTALQKYAA